MKPFGHYDAACVEEAISFLKEPEKKNRCIAGGTDLLGVLKDEILSDYPDALINLKTIAGMDSIRESAGELRIGATAKIADIASSPLVREGYPALSQAAEAVASPEIRTMATIGGNLCQDIRCWYYRYPHSMGGRMLCLRKGSGPCHAGKGDNRYHAILGAEGCVAVCPSDTAVALSALAAGILLVGEQGVRRLAVEAFFTPFGNALKEGELLKEIGIPVPPPGSRQVFVKFTERKPIDFAIASVALLVTMDQGKCASARVFLGGVAPMPWRAHGTEQILMGKIIDAETAERAAHASVAGAKPLSGNGYKLEITKALVKRALLASAAGPAS